MNLNQFLDYRSHCPMCDEKLTVHFYSTRKHSVEYMDGQLVAMSNLDGLKRGDKNYKVGYCFSMDNDSFSINFFNEDKEKLDRVPKHLMDKFRKLNINQNNLHCFDKTCKHCHGYSACSDYFPLNFRTSSFGSLSIDSESFLFGLPTDDGYKVILMDNTHYTNSLGETGESCMYIWYCEDIDECGVDEPLPEKYSYQKLPLISFVSKEETGLRLSNLLAFV